ncbi:MAG: hypothetical protein HYZ77_03050, partial [Serratia liquefaciens]|nr:hypothetical protein [Serratia liquefaciens]
MPLWLNGYFDTPLTIAVAMTQSIAQEKLKRRRFDLVMVKAGRGPVAERALLAFIKEIAGRSK